MNTRTALRIPAPEQWLADSGIPGSPRQDDRTLCHIDRLVETLARDLSSGARTLTVMVLLFTIDRWRRAAIVTRRTCGSGPPQSGASTRRLRKKCTGLIRASLRG